MLMLMLMLDRRRWGCYHLWLLLELLNGLRHRRRRCGSRFVAVDGGAIRSVGVDLLIAVEPIRSLLYPDCLLLPHLPLVLHGLVTLLLLLLLLVESHSTYSTVVVTTGTATVQPVDHRRRRRRMMLRHRSNGYYCT